MLISKKELLAETGISYGQLYRWKREHLIPEEWFIKQSSFTGQETFFPKEQMLARIRSIQELKDKYSLEELAKLLSPEMNEDGFHIKDIVFMEEIDGKILAAFQNLLGKDIVSYMEVLVMVALSRIIKEIELEPNQIADMLKGIESHLQEMKSTAYIFTVFHKDNNYYGTFYQEQTSLHLDNRFIIAKQVRMNDISNEMKIKYRGKFNVLNNDIQDDKQTEQSKKTVEAGFSSKDKQQKSEQENDTSKTKEEKDDEFVIKINNWEVRL